MHITYLCYYKYPYINLIPLSPIPLIPMTMNFSENEFDGVLIVYKVHSVEYIIQLLTFCRQIQRIEQVFEQVRSRGPAPLRSVGA